MALTYDELLGIQKKREKKIEEVTKQIAPKNATTKTSSGTTSTKPYAKKFIENEMAPYRIIENNVKSGFTAPITKAKPTVTTSTKKKEDERTWFKKGSYFDDGYDRWDVTKTILGSVADVGENIGTGIIGMGEKVTDALAVVGTALSEAQTRRATFETMSSPFALSKKGNEFASGLASMNYALLKNNKKTASEFVIKELYDEEKIAKAIISAPIKSLTGMDVESASVFGEKSDALVQSAGQLLATAGLQVAGVPWFLATGATSFGAEAEGAFKEGATFEQGAVSAAISAGAEILSEKLSGGIKFGGKTLDDVLLKPLTEKITNKVAKTLVNLGADAFGEGFEEVFSGVVSNLGSALYKEESIGELLASEEAFDEYLESFIGGMVLGGGSSTVNAVASRNSIELSENEQKVVDKVVEDRINKEKEDGNKVTKKKEAEIRNAVLRDMQKGYIDTDTIESILGGDTYKTYKETADREAEVLKRFEELGNKANATLKEQAEFKSVSEMAEALKNNPKSSQVKNQLSEEVSALVKDSRLSESYNEKARRKQTFEADLSKYDAKQQETVKKAVESGILNNTNRTHEFVDMIAKISADKGVSFDFTSNEKIKASGFAVEGRTVNCYVTGDGNVAVNINSAKALNSVVGHEITHILEGTELYSELQTMLKAYAESKGEYQTRYDEIAKLYEGIKDADIDKELTADLVGDYLLTDYDFIKQISVENRNVFQRLWDEVKYLCKVASARSKEAREFEKVKRSFEKAYKEAMAEKSTADEGGVRYSISNTSKMTLKEQLNLFYKNELKSSDSLYLGMTPSSISASGLEELPLAFPITNYDKSRTEKHNVPRRSIKTLNENLENALFSFGSENKIGFVVPDIDADGKPLLVGIEKDVLMDRKPTNVIRSVYGLDNPAEWIENQIKDSKNFVIYNEKEANSFLQTYGYSASVEEGIKLLNNSIPDSTKNVNTPDSFSLSAESKNTDNIVAPMRHEITGKDFRVKGADGTTQNTPIAEQQALVPVGHVPIETKKKEAVKENLFPMLDESEVATDQKTEQRPSEEILGESQVKAGDPKKNKDRMWPSFVRNFVSKGSVFETFALQTKNRAVEDKYKMWKDRSEAKAQYFMENGKGDVKSLKAIRDRIIKSGLEKEFDLYMKHRLNVDRMKEDKPVFGYDITAEASLKTANKLQEQHPEFKEWAKDVYAYNDYLRQMMVDGGLLTQETADLWAKKYPNYIPIERLTDESVKRGGKGVGISAPIKKSTGGNSTMETLLNTLAHRTTQVFKAIDKNAFGVELKNALYTDEVVSDVTADEIIDNVPLLDDGSLIKPGVDGNAPTFTVFENGKRVTFNIKEEMYEALKPTPEGLSKTFKVPHTASSWHKKVLTEYNLFFTARNFPKDAQEVIFNSRHAAKTYANMPVAFKELLTGKGKYVQEYWENGGKSNTYFDREANAFENDKGKIKKALGFVPDQISKVNDFVEAIPRLAEYIASRKKGATIEASMLDAARVTTDFSDGGDITKYLNRNGATFLNASVQGAAQQVRNIRQAKAEGFKGIMKLIGKYALSGLPVLLFNNLIWDDDEEYEELSEYVKDNYYVIAKYGDGKFVRIPKGRTAAVLQDAVEQISKTVTGKESDWLNCLELLTSNLAPSNPIENNVIAPIMQAASNKTWYGEDLVPARLQKLPAREQYDEAIDSISKWLGENTGISPYKINYVLNQYSGFVGDMVLPALTPEAENGSNSVLGNMIAPLKDQFTTDSVLKNNAPSDFFSLSDELEINSNSKNATDEDKLKYKYISSVSSEISDLYKQKREIQNSDLSDKLKFEQVRDIQKQINETAKKALNGYENVKIDKRYAKVGGIQYRFNDEGEWQKLTDEQLKKQKEVTGILGITPGEYWSNKDVYDMKALKPELYKALQEEGVSVKHYKENIEKWIHLPNDDYSWAANNPDKAIFSKAFYDSVVDYRKMTSELYDIKADKDENGNSISGSAKEKKKAYIWSLDIPEGAKHLLFRSEYNSYDDYNAEIIEYVKGLKLTTGEKKTVLEKAGFKVEDNGRITWD